jgi:REP element-mobilizing transposase RayT
MDAPVPVEDENMPEEPLSPPQTAPETGDQAQQAGLHWQPLEASHADGEDLASIFQGGLSIPDPSDAHPGEGWTAELHKGDVPDEEKHGEKGVNALLREELASLAKTVFDTTFYLVPRMNNHYLLGELAQTLRQSFPELCKLYGWELSVLSVRPDYLKWTLVDFPECLTRDALAVVRRWTSGRLFASFPQLQTGNPSQDFWSPGYLVDTQNREFPTQVLIAHVARDQGR